MRLRRRSTAPERAGGSGAFDRRNGAAPRGRGVLLAVALTTWAAAPHAAGGEATDNRSAAAAALEGLSARHPLSSAFAAIESEDQAHVALNQLAGEVHASLKTAIVEESRFVRGASIDRIRAAFNAIGAPRGSVLQVPDPGTRISGLGYDASTSLTNGPLIAPDPEGRFALWSQAIGSWGTTYSDGNAASLSRSTGGVLAGTDSSLFDPWRVGVLAGYTRTTFDVADRVSSGTSDNYHLGIYAGRPWGSFALRAGAAHGWHNAETQRTVAFADFADTLTSSYQARSAQVFGEVGYGIDAGPIKLEPFVGLAYVNVQTDAFSEAGGAAALVSPSSRVGAAFGTLGLRGTTEFTLGTMAGSVSGSIARHALGNTTPSSTVALSGSDPFTVSGAPFARDGIAVDADLDVKITEKSSVGVSYGGQFGDNASDQNVKGKFAVSLWPPPLR